MDVSACLCTALCSVHVPNKTAMVPDTLESPRPCTPQGETRTERIALLTKANYDLRTLLEIQQNAILRMREELRMMQELRFPNKGELADSGAGSDWSSSSRDSPPHEPRGAPGTPVAEHFYTQARKFKKRRGLVGNRWGGRGSRLADGYTDPLGLWQQAAEDRAVAELGAARAARLRAEAQQVVNDANAETAYTVTAASQSASADSDTSARGPGRATPPAACQRLPQRHR